MGSGRRRAFWHTEELAHSKLFSSQLVPKGVVDPLVLKTGEDKHVAQHVTQGRTQRCRPAKSDSSESTTPNRLTTTDRLNSYRTAANLRR